MYSKSFPLVTLVAVAQAHMSMFYPPPLGGAPSINKQSTSLDKEFNFPLGCCGSDGGPSINSPGLCRGHLDKYDTETAQVTWQPGQDAYFQLTDFSYDPEAPGGTHSGGSCQVGFSIDKGVTWKLAASYHGACPYETEAGDPKTQTFDFKVPTGMPEGDALFNWVWLNREHESFSNCARVHIGGAGSSNSTTPTQPYPAAGSSTSPNQPAQSATSPKQPKQSSTSSEGPDDENPSPSHAGDHPHRHHSTATAGYDSNPTQAPDENTDDSDADSGSDSGDSNSQGSEDSDAEGSGSGSGSDSETDSDDESDDTSTSYKAHPYVKPGARRYVVDNTNCECARDELILATRCFCDASSDKRATIERKAVRLHRRTFYKRVDACDWATAPPMEVSYYTKDAKCAPNAKINFPESDNFELKWDVSCGVVQGKTDYQLKTMNCNMYAAH